MARKLDIGFAHAEGIFQAPFTISMTGDPDDTGNDVSYTLRPIQIPCSVRSETFDEAYMDWVNGSKLKPALQAMGFQQMTRAEEVFLRSKWKNFPNPQMNGNERDIIFRIASHEALEENSKGIQILGNREEGRASAMISNILVCISPSNYKYEGGSSNFDIDIQIHPYGVYFAGKRMNVGEVAAEDRDSQVLMAKLMKLVISAAKENITTGNAATALVLEPIKLVDTNPEHDPAKRAAYAQALRTYIEYLKTTHSNYVQGWATVERQNGLYVQNREALMLEGTGARSEETEITCLIDALTTAATGAEKLNDPKVQLTTQLTKAEIKTATEKGDREVEVTAKYPIFRKAAERACWDYRQDWFEQYKAKAKEALAAIAAIYPN
jgi:hypothetical protein